jgi:UMF1 family MFS transporter
MLIDVSTEQNRGLIGGLGIGVGYAGSFFVVIIGLFINSQYGTYELAFLIISLILALFAIQLLFFTSTNSTLISSTSNKLKSVITNPIQYLLEEKYTRIRKFLLVKFWYMSAINAGITFISLFAVETVGIPPNKIPWFLFVGIIFSIPGALFWGLFTDKFGARRCLILVISSWILGFLGIVLIPLLNLDQNIWWIVISFTGLLLGGVWVADRPILIQYSGDNDINESFGLYNVAGRAAYLFGSFLWWVFTAFTPYGQIGALSSLVVCLCIALILLVPFKMLSDAN